MYMRHEKRDNGMKCIIGGRVVDIRRDNGRRIEKG